MATFTFTPGVVASLSVGIPALLTSLATLVAALRNGRKTDSVHQTVNGRQTALEAALKASEIENARLHAQLRDRRSTDPEGAPHA